jgi:hypothetical protein
MSSPQIDRLADFLSSILNEREELSLLLYTPFGIARGKLRRGSIGETFELHDVTVEHYSNHLPTGHYKSLLITLSDVQGCAVLEEWSASGSAGL